MDLRSPAAWLVPAALVALVALAPTSAANAHGDLPPVLPSDLRADPSMENVTADTEEIAFTIELMKVREYSGEFHVDLQIGGEQIAAISEVWPPDTDRMNVTTDEDADEGPGYWQPTVGLHPFNLTVEAEGSSFPLDFELPMGPDLTLSEDSERVNTSERVRTEPASPGPGDDVTFLVNVTNQGTWATPDDGPVPVVLSVDGEQVGQATLESLGSQNDTTLRFEEVWTAQTGHHTVSLSVDPDAVEEVRTDNNEHNLTFTIAENGLRATALDVDPSPAENGTPVTVTATILNGGDDPVGDSTTGLYRNGDHVAQADTPPLDPGEQANVTWEIQPPAGVHELTALVNADDAPSRPPTGPMTASSHLVVGPDLLVTETNTTPYRPVEGNEVTVTGTVENRGAPLAGNVTVDLLPQDAEEPVARTNLTRLDTDGSQPFRITYKPEAGDHVVQVRVDPDEEHEEAVTDNNHAVVSFSVRKSAPDVEVEALQFARTPLVGQPVPANLTVANHGADPVDDLVAHVKVNGTRLGGAVPFPQIDPGENETVQTRSWTPQPGVHTFEASVGTPRDLAIGRPLATETATLAVDEARPELTIGSIDPRPASPEPGDDVRLSTEITNTGEVAVPGFDVRFEVDGEAIGTQHVDGLEPGETAALESPNWTLDPATEQASVYVDPGNDVFENASHAPSKTVSLSEQATTPAAGLPGLLAALLVGLGARRARS